MLPCSRRGPILFHWAGQLREHAAGVGDPSRQLSEALPPLDRAVAARCRAAELYAKGREASAAILADFDKQMAESNDDTEKSKLRIDRKHFPSMPTSP